MVSAINSSSTGMQGMAQMAQMRANMFKKSDADSSGGLDVEEFKGLLAHGPGKAQAADSSSNSVEDDFASFDADGDGSLTQTELDDGMEARMAEFRSTVDRFGGGPGGPGGPPPGPPPEESSGSDEDSDDSDPLQTLLAALQGSDAKSQKVADQLRQLLQGLMDDSGSAGSGSSSGSSLSVAA